MILFIPPIIELFISSRQQVGIHLIVNIIAFVVQHALNTFDGILYGFLRTQLANHAFLKKNSADIIDLGPLYNFWNQPNRFIYASLHKEWKVWKKIFNRRLIHY